MINVPVEKYDELFRKKLRIICTSFIRVVSVKERFFIM